VTSDCPTAEFCNYLSNSGSPKMRACCGVSIVFNITKRHVSETKRDRRMVTRKLEQESGIPDSESAISFTIASTVPPFWLVSAEDWKWRILGASGVHRDTCCRRCREETMTRHGCKMAPDWLPWSHNGWYLVRAVDVLNFKIAFTHC